MLKTMRRRTGDEGGFTLIELLVVILIIGILAAIAIPSFLNQKSKSTDASAKELARTAQTTAETYASDNQGSYLNMSASNMTQIEPTIQTASGNNNAYLSGVTAAGGAATPTATGYRVTTTAVSGNQFWVDNNAGVVTRGCSVAAGASSGGCPNGTW